MSLTTSNIKIHPVKDKKGSEFIVTELCGAGRWGSCLDLQGSERSERQQKFLSSACATHHLHIG